MQLPPPRAKTKCTGVIWQDCDEFVHPLDKTELPRTETAATFFQAAAQDRRHSNVRRPFCDIPNSLAPLEYEMPGAASFSTVRPDAPFTAKARQDAADNAEEERDRTMEIEEIEDGNWEYDHLLFKNQESQRNRAYKEATKLDDAYKLHLSNKALAGETLTDQEQKDLRILLGYQGQIYLDII